MATTEVRVAVVWAVLGLFFGQALGQSSPCGIDGNKTSCLEGVRQYFDSTDWWFGNSYSTECPGVTPATTDAPYSCYNPSTYKTIGSRLLQRDDFNVNNIQQVLRIRYFAKAGGYHACGHRYDIPEVRMSRDVDSTRVQYVDSWSLRRRPAVIWEAQPDTLYTLAIYDVGEMNLAGLWVNIYGSDSALGEEVVPYMSFLNPVDRETFLVFALFVQNETVPEDVRDAAGRDFWMSTSYTYLLTTAIEHLGHRIRDPMAVGYVSLFTDPYAIQVYKDMSLVNNCPFLLARQKALMNIMNGLNLTDMYSTARDTMNVHYFDGLEVQAELLFWSDALTYNVCCTVRNELETLLNIDAFASPVPLVHLRYSPNVLLSPVHSEDTNFFFGKWFTLLLADVTDIVQNTTDPVTSVVWLVTDHEGPSAPGSRKETVHRNYTMPDLAVGETRLYMLFVFRQQNWLGDGFSMDEYCRMNHQLICDLDIYSMADRHDLHFSGVNWFRATADSYVRWKMIEENPANQNAVCNGVQGYANPCPVPQPPTPSPATTQRPPPGTTQRGGGNASGHLAPSWSFKSYLLSVLVFSFLVKLFSSTDAK